MITKTGFRFPEKITLATGGREEQAGWMRLITDDAVPRRATNARPS